MIQANTIARSTVPLPSIVLLFRFPTSRRELLERAPDSPVSARSQRVVSGCSKQIGVCDARSSSVEVGQCAVNIYCNEYKLQSRLQSDRRTTASCYREHGACADGADDFGIYATRQDENSEEACAFHPGPAHTVMRQTPALQCTHTHTQHSSTC